MQKGIAGTNPHNGPNSTNQTQVHTPNLTHPYADMQSNGALNTDHQASMGGGGRAPSGGESKSGKPTVPKLNINKVLFPID